MDRRQPRDTRQGWPGIVGHGDGPVPHGGYTDRRISSGWYQNKMEWLQRLRSPDSGYLEAPILQQPMYSQVPDYSQLNLLHPPPVHPSISDRLGLSDLVQIDYLTLALLFGAVGAGAVVLLYLAIVDSGRGHG